MVVLPDALFAQSTKAGDKEEQDEGVIRMWVDPHQLKKIDDVWQKDGRRVVTAKSPYMKQLIHDHHDLPVHGHPGISRTMDLLQRRYWWPRLRQDMIQYVRGCAECQRHKVNTRPTKAPLAPIFPEPKANPFEVIALDFITDRKSVV